MVQEIDEVKESDKTIYPISREFFFSHANRHIFNLLFMILQDGNSSIFLTGSPGVGKKRLVHEALNRHDALDCSIFFTFISSLSFSDFVSELFRILNLQPNDQSNDYGPKILLGLNRLQNRAKRPIAMVLQQLEQINDKKIVNLLSKLLLLLKQNKLSLITFIGISDEDNENPLLQKLSSQFEISLKLESINRRAAFEYMDDHIHKYRNKDLVYTREAKFYIYSITNGNIGLINSICSLTAMISMQLNTKRITEEILNEKILPYILALPKGKEITEKAFPMHSRGIPLATRLLGSNVDIPVSSREFNIIFSERTEDTGEQPPVISVKGYQVYAGEMKEAKELYKQILDFLDIIYASTSIAEVLDIDKFNSFSIEIIRNLVRSSCLVELAMKDYIADPLINHTLNAAILSVLIGIKMGLNEDNLIKLTILALIHDIGRVKIPKNVLEKKGRLTDDEIELIKKVPIYSYNILKLKGEEHHSLAELSLQAYEREDGTGYPHGLKSDQIDPLIKIIKVADTFEAYTHNRTWRSKIPAYDALQTIGNMKETAFDSRCITALFKAISVYPIGSYIQLNTGEIARVLESNTDALMKPIIAIEIDKNGIRMDKPKIVDLRGEFLVFIDKVLGASEIETINIELAAKEE